MNIVVGICFFRIYFSDECKKFRSWLVKSTYRQHAAVHINCRQGFLLSLVITDIIFCRLAYELETVVIFRVSFT